MNNLPISLMNTIDKVTNPIAVENIRYNNENVLQNDKYITLYSINEILIENVGRFCENYKGDYLISLFTLINRIQTENEGAMFFGIRKLGVDGNAYIFHTLKDQHPRLIDDHYRKIFLVTFIKKTTEYGKISINVNLYDVTTSIRYDIKDNDFNSERIDCPIDKWELKDIGMIKELVIAYVDSFWLNDDENLRKEIKEIVHAEAETLLNQLNGQIDNYTILSNFIVGHNWPLN